MYLQPQKLPPKQTRSDTRESKWLVIDDQHDWPDFLVHESATQGPTASSE